MKKSDRYRVNPNGIRTLQDIRAEKARLRDAIEHREHMIRRDYRNILEAFTLKNLAGTVLQDLGTNTSLIARAFHAGKKFMEKRKAKKRDAQE
jgi:DNA-binding PadR family transcriptional regulator